MAHTESPALVRALFTDDDVVLSAVKTLRDKGHSISEVYSPFPIHGLDKAMGLKETRLAIASFIYGLIGLTVAILITWYMMNSNWAQDIGGKPSMSWGKNMPSFVPTIFELTVFFAAHLMVWTYFILNKLYPGAEAQNPDPRTTDDHFMIEMPAGKGVIPALKAAGAIEIIEA